MRRWKLTPKASAHTKSEAPGPIDQAVLMRRCLPSSTRPPVPLTAGQCLSIFAELRQELATAVPVSATGTFIAVCSLSGRKNNARPSVQQTDARVRGSNQARLGRRQQRTQ